VVIETLLLQPVSEDTELVLYEAGGVGDGRPCTASVC
jgi:hypothetical protein